jgi:hypothetical protein
VGIYFEIVCFDNFGSMCLGCTRVNRMARWPLDDAGSICLGHGVMDQWLTNGAGSIHIVGKSADAKILGNNAGSIHIVGKSADAKILGNNAGSIVCLHYGVVGEPAGAKILDDHSGFESLGYLTLLASIQPRSGSGGPTVSDNAGMNAAKHLPNVKVYSNCCCLCGGVAVVDYCHVFNLQKLVKRHVVPWSMFGGCKQAMSK